MLILTTNRYRVTIASDSTHGIGSADNVNRYDHQYFLGDARADGNVNSRRAVEVFAGAKAVASAILVAGGGTSGIHPHSAILGDGSCFVAVGPYVACLLLPSLRLIWETMTDDATCFGIYDSPRHGCLFSHGELSIARVSYNGTVIWRVGGADIFANGFGVDGDLVRAVDFNEREYAFEAETGREVLA